jgi:hypothetical protein
MAEIIFLQFTIERRTADAEAAGDFAHLAAIVFYGKGDGFGLELDQRADIAARVEEL